MKKNIHPTALIHRSAKISKGVQIGAYAVIGAGTEIGEGTIIGPHAVVEFATLGRENKIYAGACIGTAPQDLKYQGAATRLALGDRNTIREYVTLNRGSVAAGWTRIGSDCMFMAYSHVAHDCRIGNHVILANSTALAGHIEIQDGAVISGLVGMHQHIRIGALAMIGGGAMLSLDILPYCLAQGDRATLRGLNTLGLRRAGVSRESVAAIKAAYRTLFNCGLTLETAVRRLQKEIATPEVQKMISFIRQSRRGIARPDRTENDSQESSDSNESKESNDFSRAQNR